LLRSTPAGPPTFPVRSAARRRASRTRRCDAIAAFTSGVDPQPDITAHRVVELYYNAHIWRGAFAAADVQLVGNPGYNQDRGPAWVFSLRGHLEF
jgi:carbohydrate-selective porin OprB